MRASAILLAFLTLFSCSKYPKDNFIVESELVFSDNELFASCHASTIVETSQGNILTAFFGGSYESHPDNCIWLSKKLEKGKWSAPRKVADGTIKGEKFACWNPVLFQVPDGQLLLFYKIGTTMPYWVGALIRSDDGGETWSEPEILPEGFLGPIKNKPIIVGDRILYGSSTENEEWKVHFESSDLQAKDWKKTKDINKKHDLIQPSMIPMPDGKIKAIFRSKNIHGPLYQSVSSDNGITWPEPEPMNLPSNNSGLDALMTDSGIILLAYNNSREAGARTPLSLFSSTDGIHWKPFALLQGGRGEYSYPSIIQARDGRVHVTFTYNRKYIKEVVLKIK